MHSPERKFWSSNMKHWFPVAVFLHLDFMDRIYDISKWNHGIKFYLQSTWQRTYSIDSNNRIGQSSNLNNRLSSRSGNEKSLRYGDAQRERERERERDREYVCVWCVLHQVFLNHIWADPLLLPAKDIFVCGNIDRSARSSHPLSFPPSCTTFVAFPLLFLPSLLSSFFFFLLCFWFYISCRS